MDPEINILMVSANWSMKMGGEASLPPIYARLFRARGAVVWMVSHARVREEILDTFPDSHDRIRFIEDTPAMLRIARIGRILPYRLRDLILGMILHMMTQRQARRLVRELIGEHRIDVVFEPTPISPKAVSSMYGLGRPVVIGPMCGGMSFPPAFRDLDSRFTRLVVDLGRKLSILGHWWTPGKLRADVLLVANERTARALPPGCRGRVITVVESGVDLSTWSGDPRPMAAAGAPVRFAFSGRFVDWKGVEYLVAAFLKARDRHAHCVLELIGDGELGPKIRETCDVPELRGHVRLHGWLSRVEAARIIRECDVFVMPSLRECGGTAILEAMALGKPVVAANWGGPAAYVNETCGLLVEPASKPAYIDGLADAMVQLAQSAELRARLGQGSLERVREELFEWEAKGDRVLEILKGVARRATPVET